MKMVLNPDVPRLSLSGLDADLTEEEIAIQETAHKFARQVMRPLGQKLDKLNPEQVVKPEAGLSDFLQQLDELGLSPLAISQLEPLVASRLLPLVLEELGWGDPGLTVLSLVGAFPALAADMSGNPVLTEKFNGKQGCWIATQPDRGSDVADPKGINLLRGGSQIKGNLHAKLSGDHLTLNGQSSSWVSGGPLAETALIFCATDLGEGYVSENGTINGCAMLVSLDQKGVSKGPPLDKIGKRPLPQGEIFFDDVEVPLDHILAGHKGFPSAVFSALTFGNLEIACIMTGVARAAYDHSISYVHNRRQGGGQLIAHQSVKTRLFNMWCKVESCRAMARRVSKFNFLSVDPHVLASITAKVHCTQMAFEVANEAIQIFGGVGLTAEYPVEKIFRDARAALIEDGENNILGLIAADWLSRTWQHTSAS
ncbi:acyl-CoA dehydrogenase family protein [Emcibacter nanhaiensis]|uniref:Acyl-CoA dehydrogenase family protein n=1 Tax=Emcibacter nanhaiensis TaxID=1505037 RepID=A0A501PGP9_9PROT|nr:acyl-CoA dehydrogenase family protein [Emcibacter nanhaiensis]TPD59258.1 acyl-CoA dehydrogenase family protein [Emcibacter nanhaiensis]